MGVEINKKDSTTARLLGQKSIITWDLNYNFMNLHKIDSRSALSKNYKGHIYKFPSSNRKMNKKEIWWPNCKGLINSIDPNTII